jgi:hypothetical protein
MSQPPFPVPPAPVAGRFTFWADMIVGGTALGPVDVAAFTCTSRLSGFGTGQATLDLPCGIDTTRLLRLWSWRLWCFYEGAPIWCGVPTGVTDDGGAQVGLTLTELPGYLSKRQFDVYPKQVYTQVEQTVIAADLAAPLSAVGVAVATSAGAGVLRDRTYQYLDGPSRADLLTNLSQVISGPQFRAEYAMTTGGLPSCTLRIAYPRVGSGAAGLGAAVPGALAYSGAWDADQLRTRTFAVGEVADDAAAGTPAPVAVKDAPQSDLPRLDAVDDWPGVIVQATLADRANTASQQQAAPALALTVTPQDAYPALPLYGVGDDVTVRIQTPLTPGGQTVTGRLVQIDIDAAAGSAAWTVSVPMPPPKVRETLTGRLGRIDAKVAGLFHGGPMTITNL